MVIVAVAGAAGGMTGVAAVVGHVEWMLGDGLGCFTLEMGFVLCVGEGVSGVSG